MQSTKQALFISLENAIASNDKKAIEDLWLEVTCNIKKTQLMKNMLTRKIDKQIQDSKENKVLANKFNNIVENSDVLRASSKEKTKQIDLELSNCQEEINKIRKEREQIQQDYSNHAKELTIELEKAMENRRNIEIDKENIIKKVSDLLSEISSNEKEFINTVSKFGNIEENILGFDETCLILEENHNMYIEDQLTLIEKMKSQEKELQLQLNNYSKIFDDVFTLLASSKERYNQQQQHIDELNVELKKLLKLKNKLIKQINNLKQNYAEIDNRLKASDGDSRKLSDQINRYDSLIKAFQKQLSEY